MILGGCNDSYLDVKPDKGIVTPSTLEDLEALMNNTTRMNKQYPGVSELLSDDCYLTDDSYDLISTRTNGLAYIWEKEVYEESDVNDWSVAYANIFIANLVLEGLKKIDKTPLNSAYYERLMGQALFLRGFSLYSLMPLFTKHYDVNTADKELGVVIKLTTDINEPIKRASVQQCYEQIIKDLLESLDLLPQRYSYKTLPDKCASIALLARVYLSMEDYEKALIYADQALGMTEGLQDFSELNASASIPFPRFGKEIIFHATLYGALNSFTLINNELYELYESNDLRKQYYFKSTNSPNLIDYRGGYSGAREMFNGLAVNELWLIKAECYSRKGENRKALDLINELLHKRWNKNVSFVPIPYSDSLDVLGIVLNERRKELFFRGLRWSDLRRLSFDKDRKVDLSRTIKGRTYNLTAENIKSYVLKIPSQTILNNNLPQNE